MALLSWTVARSRPQAHRFLTLMGRVTARFSNHFSSKNMAMVRGGGVMGGGGGRGEGDATATVQLPGLMGGEEEEDRPPLFSLPLSPWLTTHAGGAVPLDLAPCLSGVLASLTPLAFGALPPVPPSLPQVLWSLVASGCPVQDYSRLLMGFPAPPPPLAPQVLWSLVTSGCPAQEYSRLLMAARFWLMNHVGSIGNAKHLRIIAGCFRCVNKFGCGHKCGEMWGGIGNVRRSCVTTAG